MNLYWVTGIVVTNTTAWAGLFAYNAMVAGRVAYDAAIAGRIAVSGFTARYAA